MKYKVHHGNYKLLLSHIRFFAQTNKQDSEYYLMSTRGSCKWTLSDLEKETGCSSISMLNQADWLLLHIYCTDMRWVSLRARKEKRNIFLKMWKYSFKSGIISLIIKVCRRPLKWKQPSVLCVCVVSNWINIHQRSSHGRWTSTGSPHSSVKIHYLLH